eukprot:2346990-Rhodomonas_salina.1
MEDAPFFCFATVPSTYSLPLVVAETVHYHRHIPCHDDDDDDDDDNDDDGDGTTTSVMTTTTTTMMMMMLMTEAPVVSFKVPLLKS